MVEIDSVKKLFDFLRGNDSEKIIVRKKYAPKLTDDQAFTVIWYIQECMGLIPDKFELCHECKQIYDTDYGGISVDSLRDAKERGYNCTRKDKGHSFCQDCR